MSRSTWFDQLSLDYSRHRGRAVARFFVWLTGLAAAVVGSHRLLFSGSGTCQPDTLRIPLAALDEIPENRFAQRCELEVVQETLIRDGLWATVYLVGAGLVLTVWWSSSWDDEPGLARLPGRVFALLAGGALLVTGPANAVTRLILDEQFGGDFELGWASAISAMAWVRWLLTGVLAAALITVLVAWLRRSASELWRWGFDKAAPESYTPPSPVWSPDTVTRPDFAVCLSGGGIRSAAFGLGALSALEETEVTVIGDGTDTDRSVETDTGPNDRPGNPYDTPGGATHGLLGTADILASVSGGGYAAAAWRIAVGAERSEAAERPILGNPNHLGGGARSPMMPLVSRPDTPTRHLLRRLVDRRDYLASGRGGTPVTAAWMLIELVWHVGLLVTVVGLVAWPIGRLIRTPIITSPDGSILYGRLATPAMLVFVVLALVLVARSFTNQGPRRTACNYIATGVGLLGLGLLTLLVIIPWTVKELIPALGELLPGGPGATSTVATILSGGVVATILRVLQAPLKTYAAYLGGALLAVGLVLFGGLVSLHASSDDKMFSGGWTTWTVLVMGYVLILSTANPDLWSLHPIYRRRLASTFANRHTDDGWTSLATKADHLPLSAYGHAPGPKPLICAVAARRDRTNTGVPVVSMTFDPDYVVVHPGPGRDSAAIETAAYEKIFANRLRARWLASVMGLAAMSGAAVAPSLGRMSMGSTNALIAALNLRLGVWMPNPLYQRGRRPGTQMLSMFKEILGRFELTDPNVYVADGGHWENLALVELVRRRSRRIISVDASADEPHSFSALLEAIELALVECGATVTVLDGGLVAMRPEEAVRPVKNWCRADISYDDGTTGRLLYVKAQASDAMPLDVLRYSKEDPAFPNYPTANQFLKEAEFCNLSILGRESIIKALQEYRRWLFAPDTEPEPQAPGPEPDIDLEAHRRHLDRPVLVPSVEPGPYRDPTPIGGKVFTVDEIPEPRSGPTAPTITLTRTSSPQSSPSAVPGNVR